MAALLDRCKLALRVSSDAYDEEIKLLIDDALGDMRRVGIEPSILADGLMTPAVEQAVVLYCKAWFGFDNADAPRFNESYRQHVIDLKNSRRNTCLLDWEEAQDAVE